jgi:hypothetical protein
VQAAVVGAADSEHGRITVVSQANGQTRTSLMTSRGCAGSPRGWLARTTMTTTTTDDSHHLGELLPLRCHYTGIGEATVTLRAKDGHTVDFTITSLMLIQLVNMASLLVTTQSAQTFRDLGVV